MRPLFSVTSSPRLTNRNGVETRIAPPRTAIGTVHRPRLPAVIGSILAFQALQRRQALAGEQRDEQDALQHQHRGVGQIEAALQQAAARADAAEQDRDRNDRERMLAREEGDENAG